PIIAFFWVEESSVSIRIPVIFLLLAITSLGHFIFTLSVYFRKKWATDKEIMWFNVMIFSIFHSFKLLAIVTVKFSNATDCHILFLCPLPFLCLSAIITVPWWILSC